MLNNRKRLKTDVLIIGGGIAGLYAGVEACKSGLRATMLVKGRSCSMGIGGFKVTFQDGSSHD